MKFAVLATLILGVNAANLKSPDYYEKLFKDWMGKFDMTFSDDYENRLKIFRYATRITCVSVHNFSHFHFSRFQYNLP